MGLLVRAQLGELKQLSCENIAFREEEKSVSVVVYRFFIFPFHNILYQIYAGFLFHIIVDSYPFPVNYRGKYYYRSGSTMQEIKGKR